MIRMIFGALSLSMAAMAQAGAGEVDVVGVKVDQSGNGAYRFNVTLRHDDKGWEHYADAWEVVGKDGTIYATRVLAHPHVNEQPFTRGKSGVTIPESVTSVTIRGHDKVHEYGGKTMDVTLPGR